MSTRNLTLGAAALYALAGPLTALALRAPLGWLAAAAALAVWGGLGGALAALLLAVREQRRALQRLERRVEEVAAAVRALPTGVSTDALEAALQRWGERVEARQGATTEALVRHLDARVLGVQAMVRELAVPDAAAPEPAGQQGAAPEGAG